MVTNFCKRCPYKIWEGKNVQNSALFVTTFDFDRKYLPNGSTYRQSEKYMINYISSPIGWKKTWWTLVHKPKSYRRTCWPTQLDFFRETIFRPLGGAGPSNFTRPTSPINCISSRTWGAGRPQVGLCPILLVKVDVGKGFCRDMPSAEVVSSRVAKISWKTWSLGLIGRPGWRWSHGSC